MSLDPSIDALLAGGTPQSRQQLDPALVEAVLGLSGPSAVSAQNLARAQALRNRPQMQSEAHGRGAAFAHLGAGINNIVNSIVAKNVEQKAMEEQAALNAQKADVYKQYFAAFGKGGSSTPSAPGQQQAPVPQGVPMLAAQELPPGVARPQPGEQDYLASLTAFGF